MKCLNKITAAVLLFACLNAYGAYRVAMIGSMPQTRCALSDAGYDVRDITIEDMADKHVFMRMDFDCLFLTDSRRFPYSCRESLTAFMKSGGDLILCGGQAFSEIVYDTQGGLLPDKFSKPLTDKVLPIFSDDAVYRYDDCVKAQTLKDVPLDIKQFALQMPLKGVSAVGFEYAGQSGYVPLIEVLDKYDRRKGFAAGVLVHYDGPFKGGNWFVCGVEDAAFYETDCFTATLQGVVKSVQKGGLAKKLAAKDRAGRKSVIKDDGSRKIEPLTISQDGRHFVYPDGRKFFMLGTNYIGSFDRKTSQARENFDAGYWDGDFKKASDAGINCMRVWVEGIHGHPERMRSILAVAKKYGIYLLLVPIAHPLQTDSEHIKLFGDIAEMVKNEPVVIGFDLMNEPYITMVGSVEIGKEKNPLLALEPYTRYAGSFDKNWVDNMAKSRDWPELAKWVNDADARNLYAAHNIAEKYISKYTPGQDYSSLYGLTGKIPVESGFEELVNAVDETFARWIEFQRKAIKDVDPDLMVTVGYNTLLEALACNDKLDFANHHLYQKPLSYEDVIKAVGSFDRMRDIYPDKPVTLGEFGFSTGLKLPNGEYLDSYTSAMAETLIYLYAYTGDYGGAMSWMVSQWPVPVMDHKAWWISKGRQQYEAGFGLYYYDGTRRGGEKPIVHSLRMFRKLIDSHQSGWGRLDIVRADTQIGAGYVYNAPDALFIGSMDFADERISFKSDRCANVMLLWDGDKLELVASCDVEVKLNLDKFGFGGGVVSRDSKTAGQKFEQNSLIVSLLEGEPLVIDRN